MAQERHFTLEEANQQLPWLKAQLQQIASLGTELSRLQEEMQALLRASRSNGHSGVEKQTVAKRSEIDSVAGRLAQLSQEVGDRGIILRDPDRGLVDFPAVRDGLEVYLCWLPGEDRIGFWHEVDTGFPGRQPL